MSETRDGDDLLKMYTRKMGKPLGTFFHHLWQDLAHLHLKWNEYVPLFGRSKARIDSLKGPRRTLRHVQTCVTPMKVKPMPKSSRADIQKAIAALDDMFNFVHGSYTNEGPIMWEHLDAWVERSACSLAAREGAWLPGARRSDRVTCSTGEATHSWPTADVSEKIVSRKPLGSLTSNARLSHSVS